MSRPTVTLHLGDCLEVLKTLEDGCVGHVVTDPPYGQTNESYDGPIAFSPDVWAECYRVTGPNAALISFAGSPTYHKIASAAEAGGWKVRQMWGWVYRDGMIASAYPKDGFDRLAPAMDPIVFATKGKVLLSLGREGKPWAMNSRSDKGPMSDRFRMPKKLSAEGRYPKSLVSDGVEPFEYFAASRQPRGEDRLGHPNQKPLALMRWLVSKLPNTGPILDPFTGSATTLVAANAEGFDAVGIERIPEYHAIAERRIAAELDRTALLEPA
jgi:DNA modification methylase